MCKERDAPAAAARRHVVLTPIELGDPRRYGRVDATLGRVVDRGGELGEDAALTVPEGAEGEAGIHSTQDYSLRMGMTRINTLTGRYDSRVDRLVRRAHSRVCGGGEVIPLVSTSLFSSRHEAPVVHLLAPSPALNLLLK